MVFNLFCWWHTLGVILIRNFEKVLFLHALDVFYDLAVHLKKVHGTLVRRGTLVEKQWPILTVTVMPPSFSLSFAFNRIIGILIIL